MYATTSKVELKGARVVLGMMATLLTATSACSVETKAPAVRTCTSFYAANTTPTLTNPKLAASTRPLCFRAFALLYSGVTRTPLYVTEHLTRASVEAARALDTRDNRFHPEDRLPQAERGELADYRGSGFDRGHMAPSGDMGDAQDDYESFSLANIVPQDGPLNRNGWADLEGYVGDLTAKLGETYVVTGPAFTSGNLKRLGEAWTMLTTAPGPDIAPYHDREIVVLGPADYARWLDPSVPARELCRPLPAGSLEVTQVR